MPIAKIHSRALLGIDAPLVTVEAHVAPGLPAFTLVGLPETAVRESRDRVRAAILSSGFEFPPRRLTVNLAPADLPKESARFDLAITAAILAAIRERVMAARRRMLARQGVVNGVLDARGVAEQVTLGPAERQLLNQAIEKLGLSGRARERILKLARSIADYDGHDEIDAGVLGEAIGYRNMDRWFAAP